MSREQKQTSEEKLAKMRHILDGHRKGIKILRQKMRRTQAQLDGATREVLKRRFAFDLEIFAPQLSDLIEKEAWARRLILSLEKAVACDAKGNLKHNPFKALASLST